MGDSNIVGDGGEVDGDGGGGDEVDGDGLWALPRPGRVPEQTSVPRIWSSTAALRNFSGKNADRFRVLASEGLK
jgi:hypothetical protein